MDYAKMHMMEAKLRGLIDAALKELGIEGVSFALEHPADMAHGDWATNVAMLVAKKAGKNPRALAEELATKIAHKKDADIEKVDIAGPGFINFRLKFSAFDRDISTAIAQPERWGWNETLKGKKVIVEYTDPNPFKEFHIGHLMSNAIGESISRLVEASGAETRRACYQGDVGLHVAKRIWESQKKHLFITDIQSSAKAYAAGALAYETDPVAKKEIEEINKRIYNRDPELQKDYQGGRQLSLDYFETIYKRLGTKFDLYFFESETGEFGQKIVEANKGKIFEESDGAVVFHAEKYDPKLHTRVFINKDGLPTYEAKELGLAKTKYEKFPYDTSIVITGNEVNDYFQVLLEAMRQVFPDLAGRTEHYSHGMLRLPSGKMSSRTGEVITATSLLNEAKARIVHNVKDVSEDVAEAAGVAAVKYSILRQASGRDIIFDFDQSLSFEGDSGPYLQYTFARAHSVIEKAGGSPVAVEVPHHDYGKLPRILVRFPEVVLRGSKERAPHHVANYLIGLAREFNSFYGNTMILDGATDQPYKLALTRLVGQTLKNGLWLLGITAPQKM